MSELKSPNFGALVIEALNNCGRSRYDIFYELQGRNPRPNEYSDERLLNSKHCAFYCVRICRVLGIDAKTAYNKYLQDKGLLGYDDKNLIQLAPREWLSKFLFMRLHIEQILKEIEVLEKVDADRAYIVNKITECRCIKDKQAEMQTILDNTRGLKPETREVLRLRFFEGLPVEYIAEKLGLYSTQVWKKTNWGLETFAKNAVLTEGRKSI